jgi:signal transduction histidine kinase
MKRPPSIGRPAKTPQRQHRELWLLYVSSLAGVLLLFALVLRGAFQQSQMALIRNNLMAIGEDLASLPPPKPGTEKALQRTRKDFATAHQQVEWFVEGKPRPVARLGEKRSLGALPHRRPGQRFVWQQGPDWIALVRPVDLDGVSGPSRGDGWLRISEGLESTEAQLHRLDASLTGAILLALVLSGVSARLISRRAVEPLEQSLSRLRQFSLDASHELRGPMAALAANAEMGLLETDPSCSSQRRRFEAIASATSQMELLVEDLLLLARQDEQRPERFQRLNLSALIDSQIALHRDGIELRRHRLTVAVEPRLTVMGQASLLQRLLRNLIDNAIRYTPEPGTIAITAHRQGSLVSIAIQDSGIGLSDEHISRVFDRFWRASADRSDGGSGLGLAIASHICSAHGGSIRVSSQPGQGSCFTVDLPAAG